MTGDTTIVIDGPLWFVGALVIYGWHAYLLWGWRRERRTHLAWWKKYDADASARHAAFMRAMEPSCPAAGGWALENNHKERQA